MKRLPRTSSGVFLALALTILLAGCGARSVAPAMSPEEARAAISAQCQGQSGSLSGALQNLVGTTPPDQVGALFSQQVSGCEMRFFVDAPEPGNPGMILARLDGRGAILEWFKGS